MVAEVAVVVKTLMIPLVLAETVVVEQAEIDQLATLELQILEEVVVVLVAEVPLC